MVIYEAAQMALHIVRDNETILLCDIYMFFFKMNLACFDIKILIL